MRIRPRKSRLLFDSLKYKFWKACAFDRSWARPTRYMRLYRMIPAAANQNNGILSINNGETP